MDNLLRGLVFLVIIPIAIVVISGYREAQTELHDAQAEYIQTMEGR